MPAVVPFLCSCIRSSPLVSQVLLRGALSFVVLEAGYLCTLCGNISHSNGNGVKYQRNIFCHLGDQAERGFSDFLESESSRRKLGRFKNVRS